MKILKFIIYFIGTIATISLSHYDITNWQWYLCVMLSQIIIVPAFKYWTTDTTNE